LPFSNLNETGLAIIGFLISACMGLYAGQMGRGGLCGEGDLETMATEIAEPASWLQFGVAAGARRAGRGLEPGAA